MVGESMTGHCICKAVELRLASPGDGVSACHCGLCRRWSGGAMFCLEAAAGDVSVSGPVARYRATRFAERAWCARCGTHLWIRDDDGAYDLMPGLFDDARELPLVREVYADRAFASARLAGDHSRVTAADYEAAHPHQEGRT